MTTSTDRRDEAALRRHYEIEKELADRLRVATESERPSLYRSVYDELFRRVPDHPQNVWKEGPAEQASRTAEQLQFLRPESVYVEIGCGDGHLERGAATRGILMSVCRTLKNRGLDPLQAILDALRIYAATGTLPPLPKKPSSGA